MLRLIVKVINIKHNIHWIVSVENTDVPNCWHCIWLRTSFRSASLQYHLPHFVIAFYVTTLHFSSLLIIQLPNSAHYIQLHATSSLVALHHSISFHFTNSLGTTPLHFCLIHPHFTTFNQTSSHSTPLRSTSLYFDSLHVTILSDLDFIRLEFVMLVKCPYIRHSEFLNFVQRQQF
jgi:hypothetical protein